MSDSFVSQAHSLSERNYGLTGRSSTIDSFRSASSSDYESSTPTPTGTIRHRPNKRPRPLSETWNNDLDTFPSDYVISCPLSSPNLVNAETPKPAQQEPVLQSRKSIRHKMVRQDPVKDCYDEKQRLLSSPKHSNSYPALKKLTSSDPPTKQEEKQAKNKASNSVSHGNSDTILCREQETISKGRMTTSSSFVKQLGDKLRAPLKKGADLTLAFRRSTDPVDSDMKSPLTPPSPKGLVVHRSELARGASIGQHDFRPWSGTGGAKAFLIQKI
ncbi:hypothetical protein BsWGS_17145 [Bradybaena similaris]